jgi:dihydroneopterin aldolase
VLISAQAVETSEYLTIETLATEVARVLCVESGVGKITVAVEKPSALTFAKGSGVQITREKAFFG